MARGKVKVIPIFKERIIKNPKTLFSINWEERLEEGKCWYENEPVFDNEGNCTMRKNLYIVKRELVGFYRRKKNTNNNFGQKPLFVLKGDDENGERK